MNRHFTRALLVAGLLIGSIVAASAGQVQVCRPSEPAKAAGPGPIRAASGTTYTANNRGCALVSFTDAPSFLAQGFTYDPPVIIINQMSATRTVQLPAGATIRQIVVQETSGGAVTGGLKIGTTANGGDVATGLTCAGNCVLTVLDSSILKKSFSSTASQNLIFDTNTGSYASGPRINVTIFYRYF